MTHANLFRFFETEGVPCEARTGDPLWLRGSNFIWLVSASKVDVFLAKNHEGHPDSALRSLFRIEAGQILCGMPEIAMSEEGWELMAMGMPGNRLLRIDRRHLREWMRQDMKISEQIAILLDGWIERIVSSLLTELAPANVTLLEPNIKYTAKQGEVFFPKQQTLWLLPITGEFRFLGHADTFARSGQALFPLPRLSWMDAVGTGSLFAMTCEEFLRHDENWLGLDVFHETLLVNLSIQSRTADEQEQQRITRKSKNEVKTIRNAMFRLSSILDKDGTPPISEENDTSPLLAVCRLIGDVTGIVFIASPLNGGKEDAKRDMLGEIVEASRVRRRRVALKDEWWKKDNGNLLGFIEDDKRPVALLQTATGYTLHDPTLHTARPVTREIAVNLSPFGFIFYRSFGDTMVNLMEMVKFGSHGIFRDFFMIVLMGITTGLLGMITPMATGMLFDTVIPSAEKDQLVQLTLALLASVFATSMFEITRSFAMLRAEGKMDSAIQSAVWDRLLRLPVPFFHEYSSGDLAMRGYAISSIRRALSGNTLRALLSSVFAVFNLFLLFYYSMKLALLGIILVAIAILFTVVTSFLRLHHERNLAEIGGRLSGLVFQLLGSVAKLRTAGAESRAFFNWAMLFARQQEHQFKATMVGNFVDVFNTVFPILSNIIIFFFIAFYLGEDKNFSTGSFIAFNAAFGGFMGAMLGATAVFTSILNIVPIFERAKPILQTAPEITESKTHPGQLNGEIEISHLFFSYTANGSQILKDISLHIKPGEFVALVGSSGSGKSTLMRLLLGFEIPTTGSIYYDNQDISGIDLGALRRQLGVVLQNGQLMSGDIFSNIIGSAAVLTIDDAWDAATQAGVAGDIRDMPMGMHTVVSDGGGTLSGGQRQRLLIARAIVNRPRILFFDEATSALDNRAQEMVSTSLENLHATRIVIAHRLSTIINADQIFVLDGGQLVQSGTYEELINREGLFADLARRQIV